LAIVLICFTGDGNLPEGSISQVSSIWTLANPFWWLHYGEAWAFWLWSFTWETTIWRVSGLPSCEAISANHLLIGEGLALT
jgi:hypothetical protein